MKPQKILLIYLLILTLLISLIPAQLFADPNEKEVSNDNSNIKINLFDYSTGTSETVSPSKNYNTGINKNHKFKFLTDAGNLASGHMNKWTGQHGFPRTGIVETKLVNGYPKLVNGESLSYLFDLSEQNGKEIYDNVGGLFQIDENGYTYFNSDDNYAEYNKETRSFELKDVIRRKNKPFPCFYPFDSYTTSNKKAQGNSGVDTTYNSFTADNANHYFGMTVETEFYKLENGKINGKDMVFNFSGDDDVWVFIDDTLVLDIGGIHTAVSGSINFNTGDVYIANDEGKQRKQGNIYTDCGIDKTDYIKHKLNVFYLERGNSASNCNISFNMPTIPKESVVLTKKVVDETGKLMDENLLIDFKFLVKKNDEPLTNYEFTLYTENGMQTNKTDSNGYMYLKNGYTAVFPNFSPTDTIEVAEVDYALNGYNVTLNGHEIVVMNKSNEVTSKIPMASSGKLSVKDTPNILFNNIVEKVTDLYITKEIEEEHHNIVNKDFNMKLELNGKPYVGEYSIGNKDYETDDGEVVIKNNETIKIEELPYGTSFKISEVKDESYTQDYTFSSNVYDVNINDETHQTTVYGKIGGTSEVVSINAEIPDTENSKELTITKEWKNDNERERPDSITFDLYKNNVLFVSNIKLNEENNWSHTFTNLFIYDGEIKNTYSVVETMIGDEPVVNNMAMGYFTETINGENNITIQNTYGGNIIIKKTIDDKVDKNPVFIFKITDRFNNVRYEFLKFSENENTKEIVVSNIALGNCTIEEIDVMRYEVVKDSVIYLEVTREDKMVDFNNKLVSAQYYTDVDYVKNHFVVGQTMESSDS